MAALAEITSELAEISEIDLLRGMSACSALLVSVLFAGLLHRTDSLSHSALLLRPPTTGVPLVSTRCSSPPLLSTQAAQPRWRAAIPGGGDALDREIMGAALPSIANLAVIPIVGAVDTFWIGRMGNALALAGQGAANQCFFSMFFRLHGSPAGPLSRDHMESRRPPHAR